MANTPATAASPTQSVQGLQKEKKARCVRLDTAEEIKSELVNSFDAFVFDLDGVLLSGREALPGAAAAVHQLSQMGKQLMVVTNNSQPTPEQLQQRLVEAGFPSIPAESIFQPSRGLEEYFKELEYRGKVYMIGNPTMEAALSRVEGIEVITHREHEVIVPTDFVKNVQVDLEIGAVVMGLDYAINYFKLAYAHSILVRNPNSLFVVTNKDLQVPVDGLTAPGTGSMIAALEASSQRQGDIVGKPGGTIMRSIIRSHPEVSPDRICMMGDNLSTDILFAARQGVASCLVETGIHKQADAYKLPVENQPTFILNSVASIAR